MIIVVHFAKNKAPDGMELWPFWPGFVGQLQMGFLRPHFQVGQPHAATFLQALATGCDGLDLLPRHFSARAAVMWYATRHFGGERGGFFGWIALPYCLDIM